MDSRSGLPGGISRTSLPSGIVSSPRLSFRTIERAAAPYPHRLPKRLTWGVHIVTAIGMAFLNLLTIFLIRALVRGKFRIMQWTIDQSGLFAGVVLLVLASSMFAGACLGIIFFLAPAAAGSGSPENKGWLNGSQEMARIFTWKNMVVRAVATVFSNASGFPVGREGPTVSMGGNFAYCITDALSQFYVRRRIRALDVADRSDASAQSDEAVAAAILDQDRFIQAKRCASAVGGACGMAMIFDSPIGGIIYMFEEIGFTSWGVDLTFSAFTATVLCDVLMRLFLEQVFDSDMKQWVIFQSDAQENFEVTWAWSDLPFFLGIALFLGPFSALHTNLCLKVSSFRQNMLRRFRERPTMAKMSDGLIFAAVCALTATFFAQLGGCTNNDVVAEEDDLELVRFTCSKDTQYNPVASLLVTTSEAAMKLLISRPATAGGDLGLLSVSDLLLACLSYTTLNICLTGIPVPSGNFTGTMLIGGMFGRAVGVAVRTWHPGPDMAKPGVYAMMGSAAMLCGFKRMSMAVVLFVSECGNDWDLVTPLMVCVCTSLALNRYFLKSGFDEEQMKRKGIDILEAEPHRSMYGHIASELIDTSKEPLPPEATVEHLWRLLHGSDFYDIPVVEDNKCLGFLTRTRLRPALLSTETPEILPGQVTTTQNSSARDTMGESLVAAGGGSQIESVQPVELLDLRPLVDRWPHKVEENMPAPRVYTLFSKAGVTCACVVSSNGEFRGIITRSSLAKAANNWHAH